MFQLPEPFPQLGFIGFRFPAVVVHTLVGKASLAFGFLLSACLKIFKPLLSELFNVETSFGEYLAYGFALVQLIIHKLLELGRKVYFFCDVYFT